MLRFSVLAIFIIWVVWQLHSSPYILHPLSRRCAPLGSVVRQSGAVSLYSLYTCAPVLFFPSIFLNLSASILFGPMLGIVYLLCGGLSSAVLCYALGSLGGGRRLLDRYGGSWGERLTNYFKRQRRIC